MRGACEKRHTHLEVVSLSFAHPIIKNSWKLSDFTYHPKKLICFAGGGTAIFRFSKRISISSGLEFALGKFNKFSVFLSLKFTPMKITEITGLKQKWRFTEILQLHTFSVFFVTSTEDRAGLLFSALKRQKPAKFARTDPEPFESDTYLLNRRNTVRLP